MCQIGYYLTTPNANNNTQNILNNCTACSGSINNCQQCLNETYCLTCLTGYFPDNQGRCALCLNYINFCTSCSNNVTCLGCADGYVVSGGGCMSCMPIVVNCLVCADAVSPGICGKCAAGYYLARNGSCLSCSEVMANCQECPTATLCTVCA